MQVLRGTHGCNACVPLPRTPKNAYLCCIAQLEMEIMSRYPFSGRLLGLFDVFGSAIAAAGAADSNRQPRARDLRRLGIDPDQYRGIAR